MHSQTMKAHKRRIRPLALVAAIAITGLLTGACTSTPTVDSTGQATASSVVVSTTQTTQGATKPATALEVVAHGVDALVGAGSYAFEATILLSTKGEQTEVELEGWVDGSDRELVMTIDRQSVTTLVMAGIATVERDGETVEVSLEEAGDAPSILILKSIQNPTFATDTTITGNLNASALANTNYDVNGSATIEIMVDSEGNLVGYAIRSNNDSWSVDVKFSEIGEDPNR